MAARNNITLVTATKRAKNASDFSLAMSPIKDGSKVRTLGADLEINILPISAPNRIMNALLSLIRTPIKYPPEDRSSI
jgi:hypothetical protein